MAVPRWIGALSAILALAGCEGGAAPTVGMLEDQLQGKSCRFEHGPAGCRARGIRPLDALLLEQHHCDLWAVQCLGDLATPAARQALAGVLRSKADVETCDGVVPIRSEAIRLLGAGGDRAFAYVLQRLKDDGPRMMARSEGATGCETRTEDDRVLDEALRRLRP